MSKKQIVIFGDTTFSVEMMRILKTGGANPAAFTMDSNYIKSSQLFGLPVFPFEKLEQYVDIENSEILLSIGYNKMNHNRETKYQECKSRGFNIHTFISEHAVVYADSIGEGCIIMPGAYIGPFTTLGICNVIRSGCVLSHHEIIGDFNWIADGCTYGGSVVQDNNCFVGLGSTVRNSVCIADQTFIGAHSYLSSNTMKEGVYIGNPAKIKPNTTSHIIINRV